jgi:hypothetical protein
MQEFFEGSELDIKEEFENFEIRLTAEKGRYMIAKRKFEKGDVILEVNEPLLLTLN